MQNKYSVIKQFLVNNLSSYKTVLGIVNVRLGAVHKLRDRFLLLFLYWVPKLLPDAWRNR